MRRIILISRFLGLFAILLATTVACSLGNIGSGDSSPTQIGSSDGGIAPAFTPTVAGGESTTEEAVKLWVSPNLPPGITDSLVVPLALEITSEFAGSNLALDIGEGRKVTTLTYVLAVPFPTLVDGISIGDVQGVWSGTAPGPFPGKQILMTEETLGIFTQWWGAPADGAVWTTAEEDLLNYAWGDSPMMVILPFESLDPRWKVLQVNGISPIWKEFLPAEYALSVPVSITGEDGEKVEIVASAFDLILPPSLNRSPDKLTTVVVTGVTALVRATAFEMEQLGILHPGEVVGDLLRNADITHISNEVPFAEACPFPDPVTLQLVFCSDPKYIELLEYIGTDVVELTGDHFADWGSEAVYYTLDMYDERGWLYYGGGRTVEEARAPLLLEHNGNLIAFIGCNGKGGFFAPLSQGLPGAVDCDFAEMSAVIAELKIAGYTVIATFQHYEYDVTVPGEKLIREFRIVSDAGADIVSGSQAHQPHTMAFNGTSLQMYGLGNLFFDQLYMGEDKVRALIARHVIYDGRYVSTEIFTVRFHDFSQPQFMDQEDRNRLLSELFSASGW